MIVCLPWIWSVPVALLSAELASAIPQNGGYIVWVSRAFGNFWGFMEGYSGWVSDVFDNSIYPLLFATYLEAAITGGEWQFESYQRIVIRASCLLAVGICNFINAVGSTSVIFAVITLLPFFAVFFIAFAQGEVKQSVIGDFEPVDEVHWGILLSTIMWAVDGWDAPANVAGNVRDPHSTSLHVNNYNL